MGRAAQRKMLVQYVFKCISKDDVLTAIGMPNLCAVKSIGKPHPVAHLHLGFLLNAVVNRNT